MYKVKSFAYLVVFVATAFTYHFMDNQSPSETYLSSTELIQTNNSATTCTLPLLETK